MTYVFLSIGLIFFILAIACVPEEPKGTVAFLVFSAVLFFCSYASHKQDMQSFHVGTHLTSEAMTKEVSLVGNSLVFNTPQQMVVRKDVKAYGFGKKLLTNEVPVLTYRYEYGTNWSGQTLSTNVIVSGLDY